MPLYKKTRKFSAVFANRLNRKSLPNAKTLTNPLQGILEGKEWLAHAAANSTNLFFRGISKPSFFYSGVAGWCRSIEVGWQEGRHTLSLLKGFQAKFLFYWACQAFCFIATTKVGNIDLQVCSRHPVWNLSDWRLQKQFDRKLKVGFFRICPWMSATKTSRYALLFGGTLTLFSSYSKARNWRRFIYLQFSECDLSFHLILANRKRRILFFDVTGFLLFVKNDLTNKVLRDCNGRVYSISRELFPILFLI